MSSLASHVTLTRCIIFEIVAERIDRFTRQDNEH